MNSPEKKPRHPNQRQLARFLNGDLSAKNQAVMEQHLKKCNQCVARLSSVESDTLGDRLLEVGTYYDQSVASQKDATLDALMDHDRYELLEHIGSGGMGDVYRARQRSMDRPVAIKVLKQSLFENDRAVARFHNEIKVAAKLNHPNIVHSYDAEVSKGLNLLVMELVEGDKLSDVVEERGPFNSAAAAKIGVEIAEGLKYASQQGMIHRDIKPQNIMLQPNQNLKITDFGLAKFVLGETEDTDGSLTLEGEVFGTPDYIAPEQIRDSGSADHRSDIYSLGCTLYFALTGHPPFAGFSVGEKLAGHLEKNATPLSELKPSLDQGLSAAIEKMMHKNPDNRFQSYDEISKALANVLDGPLLAHSTLENSQATSTSGTGLQLSHTSRRLALVGGPIVVAMALWFFGWIPIPFLNTNDPPNSREGKIKFAVVIPSRNAFHPEIEEITKSIANYKNAELEYIADQAGRVKFSSKKRDAEPQRINVSRTLDKLDASDFDAVIFTGGWDGNSSADTVYAFDPALNADAKVFAGSMMANRKPVGSICGGTVVLANAGLIRGKNVANCRYISDEIKENSGGIWTEKPRRDDQAVTVNDGLLVTGGNYINGPEVIRLMMQLAEESRKPSDSD